MLLIEFSYLAFTSISPQDTGQFSFNQKCSCKIPFPRLTHGAAESEFSAFQSWQLELLTQVHGHMMW